MEWSEMPRTDACLRTKRSKDWKNDILTASMLSGDLTRRAFPDLLVCTESIFFTNVVTHKRINCRSGRRPNGAILNQFLNARWVKITEWLLENDASTANERCSLLQRMMKTELKAHKYLGLLPSNETTPRHIPLPYVSEPSLKKWQLFSRTLYIISVFLCLMSKFMFFFFFWTIPQNQKTKQIKDCTTPPQPRFSDKKKKSSF